MGCCAGKPAGETEKAVGAPPARVQKLDAKSQAQREANWKSTGVIGLRDRGLRALPAEVLNMAQNVRAVDASNNRLAELPDEIAGWENIQKLVLANNVLERLPSSTFLLRSLKVLVLDSNKLSGLSEELGLLEKLERLSLQGNTLEYLPASIGALKQLTQLNIKGNQIKALPSSLGTCSALEEVEAEENRLEELPTALGYLKYLKTLNLDNNPLRQVPPNLLRDCTSLTFLSLHGTQITPESLEKLQGYEAYEGRRRGKHNKQLAGNVMIGAKGLDDGVDYKR